MFHIVWDPPQWQDEGFRTGNRAQKGHGEFEPTARLRLRPGSPVHLVAVPGQRRIASRDPPSRQLPTSSPTTRVFMASSWEGESRSVHVLVHVLSSQLTFCTRCSGNSRFSVGKTELRIVKSTSRVGKINLSTCKIEASTANTEFSAGSTG